MRHGRAIPPTGELDVYPLLGLLGWTQMLEFVGTGTQLVDEAAAAEVVLGFTAEVVGLAVAAGQVYTEVERVGAGATGPTGGYLDLQPGLETELEE